MPPTLGSPREAPGPRGDPNLARVCLPQAACRYTLIVSGHLEPAAGSGRLGAAGPPTPVGPITPVAKRPPSPPPSSPRATPASDPDATTGGTELGPLPTGGARRRQLERVVLGVLGGCALILLAAGVRLAFSDGRTGGPDPHGSALGGLGAVPPSSGGAAAPSAPADPAPNASAAAAAAAPDTPTTGMLRLIPPARPGHVWLDGQKLNVASTVVDCGHHDVRIGDKGRAHAVDVPCGGEKRLSR